MKILVTGASGFIGSHMVEYALRLGHEVWAALRPTSSRRNLRDERIRFITLDYTDARLLDTQLRKHSAEYGCWDVVIHCAGATKCSRHKDFYTINYDYTRRFADALVMHNMVPRQFIFVSTLGTYGPIRESQPYRPISEADTPQPNTDYGRSKRMAEEYLMSLPSFPYLIFRPTGVYGPRDRDYAILISSIRHHVELTVRTVRQELTFLYVDDLVKAVFLAVAKEVTRRSYFVTDGNVYTARDFGDTVQRTLGISHVFHIVVPQWVAWFVAMVCDVISHIVGRAFTFNSDKFRILKQRNWTCDIEPLVTELGFRPEYDLKRGIKATMA
ncbi:MAG: NAD(P)-dependent oxidoreductase [Bacteroidaceae bacterium]|nr:NAD(P)-dependent oxidoreductase [Bacteroidaceae bacterium]MBO7267315.1 NAD(P)-dependent oxidoreductase [Bacteroidaceae bacterium]